LVLVGAVHLGGGGNQRRHGYRVGDCSAEGGTRLGCVRGAHVTSIYAAARVAAYKYFLPQFCWASQRVIIYVAPTRVVVM